VVPFDHDSQNALGALAVGGVEGVATLNRTNRSIARSGENDASPG
jgi:hypothetical protein